MDLRNDLAYTISAPVSVDAEVFIGSLLLPDYTSGPDTIAALFG